MRKNFRKVPQTILSKLETLQGNSITVYSFISLSKQDIVEEKYAHLDLFFTEDKLNYSSVFLPKISTGRYSKYNFEGREIKLRDLPKVYKSFSFDSPNFGDSSKGYHTVNNSRLVLQKKLISPMFLKLIFELSSETETDYIFKVHINTLLDRTSPLFYDDLLFHCNLLQENIRNCDITASNISDEEYIETMQISWELLPPGELDIERTISILLPPKKSSDPIAREIIKERLLFFNSLGAINYIKGTNKYNSYKGARFPNDVVLLESFDYGNAVYIFKNEWETLSQLSRTELLSNHSESIIRIKHTSNWKNNIKLALADLI